MNWKFTLGKAAANFRRYLKRKERPAKPLPKLPGSGEVVGNDPHQAAVAMVENVRPVRDNGKGQP